MFDFSRLLPTLKGVAIMFAANEVAAATPYVKKALDEVPDDIKSADPVAAFLKTATDAYNAMKVDPKVVPSFTGLLGAVAGAFVSS